MDAVLPQTGRAEQPKLYLNDIGMHVEFLPIVVQEFLYHAEYVNGTLSAPG